MAKNVLVSGLGGGLDVINASVLYHALKNDGIDARLGSTKSAPLSALINHAPFSDSGTEISPITKVNFEGRYVEPQIAEALGEDVIYFARNYNGSVDIHRLSDSIKKAYGKFGFSEVIFVDAGGDALHLTKQDGGETSETIDPFEGQDAQVLEALVNVPNSYLAVISAGLDISQEAFSRNLKMLSDKGAYFGRVNLVTGEKEDYHLSHVLPFASDFVDDYSRFAEKFLVLSEADLQNPAKKTSHTAVVTYYALNGKYGLQRTFVPWEPVNDSQKGVIVKPEHCWVYFFDASKIHPFKIELHRS